MKQNQKKRFNNGRFNNRNQQKQITRNTVFDSTGPCGKLRGTPLQLTEKYQAGAKDALMQNDIVLAQTCMQYADHYIRLQNQAIQNEQRLNQNNQMRQQQRSVDAVDEGKVEIEEGVSLEIEDTLPEIQSPAQIALEQQDEKPLDVVVNVPVEETAVAVKVNKRKPRTKKQENATPQDANEQEQAD